MCCNKNKRCRNNNNVLGASNIPRIALRGPGCINGTGRCDVVLGTGGGCCRDRDDVAGTGGGCCREQNNVAGAGGRCWRGRDEVLGTGGNRFRCNNVQGTGGNRRKRCCHNHFLETPTTVPR